MRQTKGTTVPVGALIWAKRPGLPPGKRAPELIVLVTLYWHGFEADWPHEGSDGKKTAGLTCVCVTASSVSGTMSGNSVKDWACPAWPVSVTGSSVAVWKASGLTFGAIAKSTMSPEWTVIVVTEPL